MEIAVLDACVLYQAGVRDFLFSIAYRGAFFPVWSDVIQHEWSRNRLTATPLYRRSPEEINRTMMMMATAFPASCFDLDKVLLEKIQMQCPEERFRKDAHLVTTAVQSDATTIITFNIRDFLPAILEKYNIAIETPDQFCGRLASQQLPKMLLGAKDQQERLKSPPRTARAYLENLAALEFRQTAALLAPHILPD